MDNNVCCKNVTLGNGESILVSENAFRREFRYKSLVAGDGIQLLSKSNEIIISRKDNNNFLEESYSNKTFTDTNIILSHGVVISDCTFIGKSYILGYGTVKDCIFLDETNINVDKIHYTTNCKFYNSTLIANTIILDECTLKKVSYIECSELNMKTSSILTDKIVIRSTIIKCEDSVIQSDDTFIVSNYLDTLAYTSPIFEGKLLKINSNYINCRAKFCNVDELNIISTTLTCSVNYFTIKARIANFACDISGSMDVNASIIILNSINVDLSSSKWNVVDGSIHLLINKLNANMFTVNTTKSCVSCNIFDANITGKFLNVVGGNNSIIKIEKMFTNDILVELENTNYTSLGGDWSTTADSLVKIGPNNVDIRLLPSFLQSVKAPFIAGEFTKIKTLPTISNKSSVGVSHIPSQNFSIVN
jgi:hypothetical protein